MFAELKKILVDVAGGKPVSQESAKLAVLELNELERRLSEIEKQNKPHLMGVIRK